MVEREVGFESQYKRGRKSLENSFQIQTLHSRRGASKCRPWSAFQALSSRNSKCNSSQLAHVHSCPARITLNSVHNWWQRSDISQCQYYYSQYESPALFSTKNPSTFSILPRLNHCVLQMIRELFTNINEFIAKWKFFISKYIYIYICPAST